jgi:hypothetical protein
VKDWEAWLAFLVAVVVALILSYLYPEVFL